MPVTPVLRMGDPRLWQVAREVDETKLDALPKLLEPMRATMAEYKGVGLAAPQIGVGLRVVIFGMDANPRYPEAEPVPHTVLINPKIEILTQETTNAWEGCLSVPGMRGLVPRPTHIRYRGVDENGDTIDREAKDFHARVVLHECDHLDGILYPSRIVDRTKFGFIEELETAGLIPKLEKES